MHAEGMDTVLADLPAEFLQVSFDEERLTSVSEPEPLDLVLFAVSPDPWGAHVGVYLGGSEVLHLCKEIGVPVVWDLQDFAQRERYGSLIGFKRVRIL